MKPPLPGLVLKRLNNQTTRTTCPYCGVGCGIEVDASNTNLRMKGDAQHPANWGKLCVKGSAVGETLGMEGRLLQPIVNGEAVDTDTAVAAVADGLNRVLAQYGSDAIGFYVSGQLLTEDYYVANKLIKGFIGTANIDTNSRLCMASAVAGYKRAFGSDTVPCSYEDLNQADLLILVGSNAAWTHPILYQQMAQAKRDFPHKKVVVIDPRRTATCDFADLHLAITPGSDALLFNGLLAYLANQHALDQDFIVQHTQGFAEALASAQQSAGDLNKLAQACGICLDDLTRLCSWVKNTPKMLTFYSQGVNQSSSGVDKSNAIINLHLATGRIGKIGAGPFSITGQPNAMGGREVGGLANQLAAHMDFNQPESIERVARFWQAQNMAQQNGLKAVDLFEAVDNGQIKAIWIMHTNPVVSMPDADFVRQALEKCPLVIVSDNMADTDTTRVADIVLPAAGWGEKDGTVTNSDRTISRQRAFLQAPGLVQADWWWITQVAQKMGFKTAFNYQSPYDIFKEHVALSAFENDGVFSRRDFNLSGWLNLSAQQYDDLTPTAWPITAQNPQRNARMFSDAAFFTPNQKANFIAIQPKLPLEMPSENYPFVLNTGRYRDQWHTMTRTAKADRLLQHRREPLLSLHPLDCYSDALQPGGQIKAGDIVKVSSRLGETLMRVEFDDGLQPGQVFAPIHWTSVYASNARIDRLIPAVVDPISGQPESKHAVVNIELWAVNHHAWFLSSDPNWFPSAYQNAYWIKVPQQHTTLWFLAGQHTLNLTDFSAEFDVQSSSVECISYNDNAMQVGRYAWLKDGQLQAILCFAPRLDDLPASDWVASLFNQTELTPAQRLAMMAGRDAGIEDVGNMICSCFQVGENTLRKAIKQGAYSLVELGKVTCAGTNCGSCIPELKQLLAERI
ncbi:MAG: molybdopterin-dependent oxidoreductase [Thiomicrospira sp.]|uniref:nitrate reductase n=1 Tax=Thiomicrospira sp. TaxID=935 RepID=UPI0019D98510|nr:nitrate reductase [Thiomicrospira sp.]MBE0494335.1 molybdopterin-dependent oxidoreductase [Thiomicrospira sp.]